MPLTINVNGLTLAHKGSMGTAAATLPDVCKTPSPTGPVPLPYPNVAISSDLANGTITITVDGGNMAANKGSKLARSTGDEPGTIGGVVSSTFIKEATWLLYSFDVKLEGANACRLTDKLFMNHQNTVCLGGWIQEFLEKNRNKSHADACLALFELIMEMLDGGKKQKYWKGRGLEGPDGRFNQNTNGGGLGPLGAPNAPPNHFDVPGHPEGLNDWQTHDIEIQKQQKTLQDRIKEFDDECNGGSRKQQKDINRAREAANRERPKPKDWKGPKYAPPEVPAASSGLSTTQTLVIVGACLLVVGGIVGAAFTGGTSLAASAAGVALVAGTLASTGPVGASPSDA
jgi:hypothetical protein